MGIFSRFADIINSNVSALLDKAEDPEKMIRLIIQEMEDTLVEVRSNSARAIADKKELARKSLALETQVDDWMQKATLALAKGREELAKAALIEKKKLQEVVKSLHVELNLVDETIGKLTGEITKLESKILETRAKQQALVIRNQAASNRRYVQKHLHRSKSDDAVAKFEQYSRKVDELEAEADLYSQSAQARTLEQELADLQAQDEIEQELAKLKQQIEKQS